MLRIGAFARLNGISAKTLRAWDELGLFRPAWVDPATGYRAYSPAQVPDLRHIVALRDLGVPIAELVSLVDGGADLRAVLTRRRHALERERREIDRRLRALDITVAIGGPGAGAGADRPDVVVRPLARESVASLHAEPPDHDLNAAFYALERVVRDARRRAAKPPGAIFHAVRPDGSAPVEVYVPVTGRPRGVEPDERIRWRDLPSVSAATTIHRGGYDGLEGAWTALERWVVAAGRAPNGRRRIVYLRFGAEPELRVPPAYLATHDADFVTELQLELR